MAPAYSGPNQAAGNLREKLLEYVLKLPWIPLFSGQHETVLGESVKPMGIEQCEQLASAHGKLHSV